MLFLNPGSIVLMHKKAIILSLFLLGQVVEDEWAFRGQGLEYEHCNDHDEHRAEGQTELALVVYYLFAGLLCVESETLPAVQISL